MWWPSATAGEAHEEAGELLPQPAKMSPEERRSLYVKYSRARHGGARGRSKYGHQRKFLGMCWCPRSRCPTCPCSVSLLRQQQPRNNEEQPHSEDSDVEVDVEFDAGPALALVVLGEGTWTGHWKLTLDDQGILHNAIDEFLGTQRGRRGAPLALVDAHITIDEISAFMSDEENRRRVEQMPNSVHGMLDDRLVKDAFDDVDVDGTGSLNRSEWSLFLNRLARRHLTYLLRKAHVSFRAFFARSQPWGVHTEISAAHLREELQRWSSDHGSRAPGVFQIGWDTDARSWNPIPPGWFSDLWYYSSNNHPLHGIFCCDWYHPLSWLERVMLELATTGFGQLTLWSREEWVDKGNSPLRQLENPILFNLLVVTIPGLLLWWALFLLWTGPCFIKNAAHLDKVERGSLYCRRLSVEILGHVLVFPLVGFFIYFSFFETEHQNHFLMEVLRGRIKAYGISWALMIMVYFNPFIAWGQPDPQGKFSIGDLIGLGQWRIEKQKFKAILLGTESRSMAPKP